MMEYVASFTDAWIETLHFIRLPSTIDVASFTDAWIETRQIERPALIPKSHLLQMRGLKHVLHDRKAQFGCRIFYRCVD